VRGRRKVALSYMKGSSTTPDERTIRPYSLAFASGAWYVIAFCERTEGLRVFRVDRVVSAEWAEGEFDVPSDFSPGAIVAEGRAFSGDAAESVRIRYSPKVARWVAEREGLELAKDGSLEVEHPLADPEWAVRHVLQYGGEAEVVGPEAVRWRVVTALQALVAPHRPSQDEHE
jgi:proteasome accessory factor C